MHNQSYFIKDFPDYRLVRLSESKFCVLSKKKGYWEEIGSCDKKGHIHVTLYGDYVRYTQLHVIVAEMFVPNPEGKTVVHHKDFDASNNDPANLLWVTMEEHCEIHHKGVNNHWFGKHLKEETRKKLSESHKGNKNSLGHRLSEEARRKISEAQRGRPSPMKGKRQTEEARQKMSENRPKKPVEQWSLDGTTLIARYESTMEAARQTKTGTGHIWSCCNGKAKSAGGYKWRYAD